MYAEALQGPFERTAPGVPPTRESEPAAVRFGARRQIGTGVRSIIVTNPARISTRRIAHSIKRKRPMKRTSLYIASVLAILLSVVALGISAAVDAPRTLMSRADYSAAKRAIEGESGIGYAGCRTQKGAAREICKAEVRAADRVKVADLQARYYGTVSAQENARAARVKARFGVAKVQCSVRGGESEPECLRAARDGQARDLASLKLAST
jgi:hypothetical protein